MKKVRLYGELGRRFGSCFELNVSTVQEALSAIEANSEGFYNYTTSEHIKGNRYIILTKKPESINNEKELDQSLIKLNDNIADKLNSNELHLVPVPKGGAVTTTAVFKFWAVTVGVKSAVLATVLTVATYVAIAVAISFVTQALFKPPAPPKPGTKLSTKSLLMAGQRNRQAQGIPVPLGYGMLKIGSANIDAKINTYELRRNISNNSTALESYSETEYIDLLCEGPIAGLVDKGGNLLLDGDIRQGIYLNNVPIKNTTPGSSIESFNYVLNEEQKDDRGMPVLKFGSDDETAALSENVSYTIEYGTKMFGPGPYLNGSGKSVYDDFNEAIKNGAFIFSHAVTDKNVSRVVFQFSVQMMQMNKDPGDSLSDAIRFAIFITKNGERINVLDPASQIESDDIEYIEGTKNATEVNGSKITRGLREVTSGDHKFFIIQGLASDMYNFSISIKYDPDLIFVDNFEHLSFSIVKLTAELDPSVDNSGSVAYDNAEGSNSTYIKNVGGVMRSKRMTIPYVQEVIDQKMIYPNAAAVKIKFDSKNFNNIPLRSYHVKMKKILIPSNYDPESRKYSGAWNGLFKGQQDSSQSIFSIGDKYKFWTNNPAWIFFDLLTNYRYGLGKYGVSDLMVDKWQLYKIAKYCDELVETNYPVETTNGILLAFTTDNQVDYTVGNAEGSFSIKINQNQYRSVPNTGGVEEYPYSQGQFYMDFGSESQFKGKKIAFFINQHNFTDQQVSSDTFVQSSLAKKSVIKEGEYNIEERFIIDAKIESGEMIVVLSGPSLEEDSASYEDGGVKRTIGACAVQVNHSIVEPRFVSNLYLTEQSEAINALNSMAALFRGMITYSAGKISVIQDSKKTPIMLFNNSNIRKKEGFAYSGFARNKKVTASLVRFNNEEKNYKPDVIYEEDPAAMQIYGYIEKETMGMGITSRSMARRLAKWVLLSSNLESEKIKFVTGSEGSFLYPGSVFEVSDEARAGEMMSGRVLNLFTKDKFLNTQGVEQEIDRLSILIDKSLDSIPNIRNVDILLNVGLSNETYESVSRRSQNQKSEDDQEVDIDSINSPQTLRFEGSVFVDEDLDEKGPQGQKTLIRDLRLKIQFSVDIGKNLIKIYNHGLNDGDRIRFSSLGILPSGLDKDRRSLSSYFVINATKNTFKVSETSGGQEVNISDQGKDFFLNEGGEHFISVENIGQAISPITLKAFKQIEIGAVFSLTGLFGSSGSRGEISSNQGVLNRIFVNQPGNPNASNWYESDLFGNIYASSNDWYFSAGLGWLHLGNMVTQDNDGNDGFWFWWSDVGWVWTNAALAQTASSGTDKIGWWYLNSIGSGIWAAIVYSQGDIDPISIYLYDNISGYSVNDLYDLGDKTYTVIHVTSDYIGLRIKTATHGNTIPTTIPSDVTTYLENSSNPAYNESEILNVEEVSRNDSKQNKAAITIELSDNHGLDLFKNRKIKIKNFDSSSSSLNTIMNTEWNTIYVDINKIELIDSENIDLDSVTISDKGEIYFIEDINIKTSRIFESQLFRTLSVKELDNNQYEVQGIEYNPSKFNSVDKDASVRTPILPIPPQANMDIPEAPSNLILTDLSI